MANKPLLRTETKSTVVEKFDVMLTVAGVGRPEVARTTATRGVWLIQPRIDWRASGGPAQCDRRRHTRRFQPGKTRLCRQKSQGDVKYVMRSTSRDLVRGAECGSKGVGGVDFSHEPLA